MLKCKVNTREFQEAITKLEVIIDSKSKIDILKTIKLSITDDKLQLTATDLENHVVATIVDFQTNTKGSIAITNIKEIMKSFKFMKEYYTEIEVKDNEIIITNGNRNIKMKPESAEDFPEVFNIGNIENSYTYNTKSLYNRIKKIDFARSKDNTRPMLTGIHFNNGDMVTLDGFRLALNTDDSLSIKKPFTIAPGTINFLNKTLNKKSEDEILINVNDKYIIFNYDNLTVASRLLDGQFFNYKEILPKEYNNISMKTKKIKDNIEFLSTYTKGTKMELTKATITDGKMELSVNTERGIFNAIEKVSTSLEVTIGFNNKYMLDALKSVESEEIGVHISGAMNPIVINEGQDSKYLVLPIRLAS